MKLCAASLLALGMTLAPLAGARAAELKILAGGSMTASNLALRTAIAAARDQQGRVIVARQRRKPGSIRTPG
jgi:kynureninase